MANGTINDPERCKKTLEVLARTTITLGVGMAANRFYTKVEEKAILPVTTDVARFASNFLPGLAVGLSARLLHRNKLLLWPDQIVRRVWQDCDGSGWLQKHLNQLKAKYKVPEIEPLPQPVPVSGAHYGVSAEAIANRTTNAETIAKGVAYATATTVVAAVSAALYLFGVRSVPMMESAPAGFGATTRSSLFDSDQNQIL